MVKTKTKPKVRVGNRKVKKKVKNYWTEDLSECIHELQSTLGASIRGSAKKYGVSESTIRLRLSKYKSGDSLKKAGRKCVLSRESEKIFLIALVFFCFIF